MLGHFYRFQDFLAMGGNGKYIWLAFGAVVGSLFGYGFLLSHQLRQIIGQEDAEEAETSDLCSS